jgi:hypothetical protein
VSMWGYFSLGVPHWAEDEAGWFSWSGEVTAAMVTAALLAFGYLLRERWRTRRIASALLTEIGVKLEALSKSCNAAGMKRAHELVLSGRQPVFVVENAGDPIFDGHQGEISLFPKKVVRQITRFYRMERHLTVALNFVNSDRFISDDFDILRREAYLKLLFPDLIGQTIKCGLLAHVALGLWLDLNFIEKANLSKRRYLRVQLHRKKFRLVVKSARKKISWPLHLKPKKMDAS